MTVGSPPVLRPLRLPWNLPVSLLPRYGVIFRILLLPSIGHINISG